MKEIDLFSIIGSVISFLLTILGFFIHKLITDLDKNIKEAKEDIYKSRVIITKHIEKIQNDIFDISTTIKTSSVTINYIQKKTDELNKMQDSVFNISNKLIAAETKLDSLGKIIYVGKNKE